MKKQGPPNRKPAPSRGPNPPSGKRPGGKPAHGARGADRAPAATGRPAEPMRIAKAIARAGLCSRREAERWIAEGRVSVNGRLLATPAFEVGPKDRVTIDGQLLPSAEPPRLWRYHKPRGLITTHHDPEGRPTVFERLPETMPRVISVGRLDFNTEGLLLLTTDGALARHMELPSTGWLRRYRVRARGRVTPAALKELADGITVEGIRYGPVEASLDSEHGANIWLTLGLREGKNREVRKILGHLGLEVGRLIRISYGPFQLLDLEPGAVDSVRQRVLIDQLGPRLAEELGISSLAHEDRHEGDEPRGQRPTRKRRRDAEGDT